MSALIPKRLSLFDNSQYTGEPSELVVIDGYGIALHDGVNAGGQLVSANQSKPRNYLRNSGFDITQNGTEFLSAPTSGNQEHTIDGWWLLRGNDSTADVRSTTDLRTSPTSKYKECRIISTSTGGANNYTALAQRTAEIAEMSGREFTINLTATCDSPKEIYAEAFIAYDDPAISNKVISFGKSLVSDQRAHHSFSGKIPNLPFGVALGGKAHIRISVWLEAGTTFDSRTGGIGTYNDTVTWYISDFCMYEGMFPRKWQMESPKERLASVQSYFEKVDKDFPLPPSGFSSPNSSVFGSVYFSNPKYRVPDIAEIDITDQNVTATIQAGLNITETSFNASGTASEPSNAARITGYTVDLEFDGSSS